MPNLLLLSAGVDSHQVALFEEVVSETGGRVYVSDSNPHAGSSLHAGFVHLPRFSAAQFLPALLDVIKRQEINIVLPTSEWEFLALVAHRALIERTGAWVVFSEDQAVLKAADKLALVDTLMGCRHLRYPQTEFNSGMAHGCGCNPVIKARNTVWGRHRADRQEIVQQRIIGDEYFVQMMIDWDGQLVTCVPAKVLYQRGGVAWTSEVVNMESVGSMCLEILDRIPGLAGPICVDFMIDVDGVHWVLDINTRMGENFSLAAHATEMRIVHDIINMGLGLSLKPYPGLRRMVRSTVYKAERIQVFS